jgi:hypothetical protein
MTLVHFAVLVAALSVVMITVGWGRSGTDADISGFTVTTTLDDPDNGVNGVCDTGEGVC